MENQIPFRNFNFVYPKILIPIGTLLNLLNIFLFSTKKLSKISISLLIKFLAVNNILSIMDLGFMFFDGHIKQNLDDLSVFSCKVI